MQQMQIMKHLGMIIYNYTGSDSYGIDDIPFSKIDEIVINGDYL